VKLRWIVAAAAHVALPACAAWMVQVPRANSDTGAVVAPFIVLTVPTVQTESVLDVNVTAKREFVEAEISTGIPTVCVGIDVKVSVCFLSTVKLRLTGEAAA